MAEETAPAKGPDVLTRNAPALSATSDMPGESQTVTVAAPPTSDTGGKPDVKPAEAPKPDVGAKPADADAKPTDGDGADAKPADAKPAKPKSGINERFSEVTAQRRAAEEKAAGEEAARKAAEARADKLAEDLTKALDAINKVVPPAQEDVRPERAKFDDPAKYDEALIAWSARAAEKKAKAEAEASFAQKTETEKRAADEAAAKAQADRVATLYSERAAKFTEEMPDYNEVIQRDDVQITQTMGIAIMTSEMGPKVAYHLGTHPEEAAKIAALPPAEQLLAMGRLEAKLDAPPKTTTTPPPIEPLTGGKQAANRKAPHEESMDEYASRRSAELRAAQPTNGRART